MKKVRAALTSGLAISALAATLSQADAPQIVNLLYQCGWDGSASEQYRPRGNWELDMTYKIPPGSGNSDGATYPITANIKGLNIGGWNDSGLGDVLVHPASIAAKGTVEQVANLRHYHLSKFAPVGPSSRIHLVSLDVQETHSGNLQASAVLFDVDSSLPITLLCKVPNAPITTTQSRVSQNRNKSGAAPAATSDPEETSAKMRGN